MLWTTEQAQDALTKSATKVTSWQSGVGCRFRVFMVPKGFKVSKLPDDFELMWREANGDLVVCQWDYELSKQNG